MHPHPLSADFDVGIKEKRLKSLALVVAAVGRGFETRAKNDLLGFGPGWLTGSRMVFSGVEVGLLCDGYSCGLNCQAADLAPASGRWLRRPNRQCCLACPETLG